MNNNTSQQKLFGISLLRVIATIGVFLVHFGQRMGLSGTIRKITDFGMYGVQLFFVISGFLIINSLDKCNNTKDILKFYIKKIIRLLVLYYLIVAWFFVSETFIFKDIVADEYNLKWFRYIFLLNGIVPSSTYLWSNVGITWTIPLFLMAYLITPILYKVLKINNTLKLTILFFVMLILSIFKNRIFGNWFPFFSHYYIFVGGMLVYKALKENHQTLISFGCLAFSFVLLALNLYFVTVLTLLFMLLTIVTYEMNCNNKYLLYTIETIDTYSYTLYLGHGIIFCSILDKFTFNLYIKLFIAIIGTLLITISLYHLYEKPTTKYLHKKLIK